MGRSKMSSLKITLLPLAICLLLSLNSQVSGKPSPKNYLIETKEKAKKSSDYVENINNSGAIHSVVDDSLNFGRDYVNNVKNDGHMGTIDDRSVNLGRDYMTIGTANNAAGGSIVENNNNYNHPYWGKK